MPKGTALITGASSGIGAEFSRLCAAEGFNLILVARSTAALQQLAAGLEAAHGIAARVLPADLSNTSAPEELAERLRGEQIDLLVNNAGFGLQGPFAKTDWAVESRMIQVNIAALLHLTKLLLPDMLRRRSGRILNVASTAAFVPGPYMSVYYASKAFVLSFSEALSKELEGTGVTATVLCPGPTRTEFGAVAGLLESPLFRGPMMDAAAVAREGYDAAMAGKPSAIAGMRNRWTMLGARLVPRTMLAAITARLNSRA